MSTETFTTDATQTAPQLMTARELGRLTKLCPDTIRRAAKKNLIPSQRCGAAIRFSPEHVAQIIANGWQKQSKAKREVKTNGD
jgi:hypothetical protein